MGLYSGAGFDQLPPIGLFSRHLPLGLYHGAGLGQVPPLGLGSVGLSVMILSHTHSRSNEVPKKASMRQLVKPSPTVQTQWEVPIEKPRGMQLAQNKTSPTAQTQCEVPTEKPNRRQLVKPSPTVQTQWDVLTEEKPSRRQPALPAPLYKPNGSYILEAQ